MARIRSIKPETWTDEKMVEMSPLARLLFIGLWNFADDEGRMVYSPTRIKLQILPADSADISELLGEIRGKLLVQVYAVDGVEYLQIVNFAKHQRVDKRTESKYPPPPSVPPNSAEPPRIPTPDQGRDQGRDQGKPSRASRSALNGKFSEFWQAYPRKKSKGDAEKAWLKLKPDEQLHDRIIFAVEQAKTSVEWQKDGGQFIPYPASWLNAKGWEDDQARPNLAPAGGSEVVV